MLLQQVKTPFSWLYRQTIPDLSDCLRDTPRFSPEEVHPLTLQVLLKKTSCSTSLFQHGGLLLGQATNQRNIPT